MMSVDTALLWQSAGFTKRKYHGRDKEVMPMPGICIVGHVWTYYITFQEKEDDDRVNSTLLLTLSITPVSDHSFIGYDLPFRDRQYESYLRHMGDRVQAGW